MPAGSGEPGDRWARTIDRVVLLGFAAGALVSVLYAQRVATGATWFNGDEWDQLLGRRGWGTDALLGPNNQHITLVPTAV